MLAQFPPATIMRALPARLNPAASRGVRQSLVMEFSDVDEQWSVLIRNGIAEVRPGSVANPDLHLVTDSATWARVAARKRNPALAFASGDMRMEAGSILGFRGFMNLFDRD